jgi:predicted nucleic acid-binding protein
MEISFGRHILDTSALVRLILHPDLKEQGSDELAAYMKSKTGFYTLDLCVGEALNVLKQKTPIKVLKVERLTLASLGAHNCIL